MPTRELSLFADLDQGRLVQSYLSTLQAVLPRFVFGDSIPVSFRPLKSNGNNSVNPWREVDLAGKIVRIAIGSPAGAATSGTFALSYGGNTTAAIAYNADGAAIQTALNALASITAAGGVVVTRAGTGAFRIVFNTAGVRTAITASTESLYPSSGAEIRVAVEGSVSAREIVVARLEALPAAFAELSDEMPVAASDIVEVREGLAVVPAVKASGTFHIGTGTIEDDTFTIGAVTFTFKTAATTENEVTIGVDDEATLANVYAKINAHSSILVSAINLVVGSCTIQAKTAGTAGNAIATTETGNIFFDAATLTGGVNYVAGNGATISLEFSVLPYSGSYSLEIGSEQTLGIPWNADASTLQAALELLSTVGAGKVVVSGDFPKFTLNFDISLGDVGAMTIDMAGLVVPKGRLGSIDTNTAAMVELLNGAAQATAKLEIELYDIADDTTWTVLQTDCTVIDDVIGNSPTTTPAFPSVLSMIAIGDTAPVIVSQTVSGTISPEMNAVLLPSGTLNGKESYSITGEAFAEPLTDDGLFCLWSGSSWDFVRRASGASSGEWLSSDAVDTPDLVTTWTPDGSETGAPVFSAARTEAPPYLRATATKGYIKTSAGWKEWALSDLA